MSNSQYNTKTAVVSVEDIYGKQPTIPEGYEDTGTFGIPQVSKTFLSPTGEICTLNVGDVIPKGPRVIISKKEHKFSIGDKLHYCSPGTYKPVTVVALLPNLSYSVKFEEFSHPQNHNESWFTPCGAVNTFKIGDRVRYYPSYSTSHGTVVKIVYDKNYLVAWDGLEELVYGEDLLVKSDVPAPFVTPVPKFKVGDRVMWARAGKDTMGSAVFGAITRKVSSTAERYSVNFDKLKNGEQEHAASDLVLAPTIPDYEVVDYRLPKKNDSYEYNGMELRATADHNAKKDKPRFILKSTLPLTPQITVESIYGDKFPVTAPEGFKLGEFKKIDAGDSYFLANNQSKVRGVLANRPDHWILGEWRYSLTKIPTPTPLSVYGTETPVAPKGWKLGKFKKVDFTSATLDENGWQVSNWDWCTPGKTVLGSSKNNWFRYELIPVPTRWLIEVEGYNDKTPENVNVRSDNGGWQNVKHTVVSVTRKP